MPLSGYQVELFLNEFRKRYGYKRTSSYTTDKLNISEEAQYEANRLHSHLRRSSLETEWVTPQKVLDLIADQTKYDETIEYEQQRRAGLFLDPIYVPLNPSPRIELVHAYEKRGEPMPQRLKEAPQETLEADTQKTPPATQPRHETKKATPSQTQEPTLNLDKIEEEVFDDLDLAEDQERGGSEADVVYGSGRVTRDSILEFIYHHPDSALKFLAQRELDGKHLPNEVLDVYEEWANRGMSRNRVRKYILELMEWEKIPDRPLADLWAEIRDRIYDLTHGVEIDYSA